jgi:hypothetical protein
VQTLVIVVPDFSLNGIAFLLLANKAAYRPRYILAGGVSSVPFGKLTTVKLACLEKCPFWIP